MSDLDLTVFPTHLDPGDLWDFLTEIAERDCGHALALPWADLRSCPHLLDYPIDWCESCKARDLLHRWADRPLEAEAS